jgi:hypothetical protein
MIKRSGDTVCILYHAQEDKECGFLCLASKPWSTVSPSLASKPMSTVLVVWPQNDSIGVSRFWPQNRKVQFGDLAKKITVMASWFWP